MIVETKLESVSNTITETVETTADGSCFLGTTRIILASGEQKYISQLQTSDIIIDKYMNPQEIIGVNYTYLGKRNLYSFGKNGPMFTSEHQFCISLDKETTVVVSLAALHKENPQLQSDDIQEIVPGTKILQLNMQSNIFEQTSIHVTEHSGYMEETKVYFLEVTGDGSYIVTGDGLQGYVAKHELPNFVKTPFTNICIGQIINIYKKLDEDKRFALSYLNHSRTIPYHVDNVLKLWSFMTEFNVYPEGNRLFVIHLGKGTYSV